MAQQALLPLFQRDISTKILTKLPSVVSEDTHCSKGETDVNWPSHSSCVGNCYGVAPQIVLIKLLTCHRFSWTRTALGRFSAFHADPMGKPLPTPLHPTGKACGAQHFQAR